MFGRNKEAGELYPEYIAECKRLEALALPDLAQFVFELCYLNLLDTYAAGYGVLPVKHLIYSGYPKPLQPAIGARHDGARLERLAGEAFEILIQAGLIATLESEYPQPTRAGIEALHTRTTANIVRRRVPWTNE